MRRLADHPAIRTAALVAHTFGLDPVMVLKETDPVARAVRIAAHNKHVTMQQESQK